jgi:hypothetical protein
MTTATRAQCPNCSSYKVWKRGMWWTAGGLFFVALSLPWVLILIGIPFLIAGAAWALAGILEVAQGNPRRCRECDWIENVDAQRQT